MQKQTNTLVYYKRDGTRNHETFVIGFALVPNPKAAIKKAKRFIREHKSFGFYAGKDKIVWLDYEVDFDPVAVKADPEGIHKISIYGDAAGFPRIRTVTAVIKDREFRSVSKGQPVVITRFSKCKRCGEVELEDEGHCENCRYALIVEQFKREHGLA